MIIVVPAKAGTSGEGAERSFAEVPAGAGTTFQGLTQ
jgi:hypothetical protein